MTVTKLDGIAVKLPGGGLFPPMDVFVNFRLVQSSNVDRVGWDFAGNTYVGFTNGTMYVYYGTSRQRAVAAAYSKSVGRYINTKLKDCYQVLKIGS